MVNYEPSHCIKCGLCIKTCHQHCMELIQDRITINYSLCSTCTQCIAICPSQSLSWNEVPSKKVNKIILTSSEQIKEFLKSRRSDWHFKKEKIDRETLKEIATIGKYSPTNNYDINVIIIDDKKVIAKIDEECPKKVQKIYRFVFRPKIIQQLGKSISPQYVKIKIKVLETLKKRTIFQGAQALIILIADPKIYLTELSAQFFYIICNFTQRH